MLWFFKCIGRGSTLKKVLDKRPVNRINCHFRNGALLKLRKRTTKDERVLGTGVIQNKKGGEDSTFFAPNLTMNLTYLCYGKSKCNFDWMGRGIKAMKCT